MLGERSPSLMGVDLYPLIRVCGMIDSGGVVVNEPLSVVGRSNEQDGTGTNYIIF